VPKLFCDLPSKLVSFYRMLDINGLK